jgi:hypothetical protein
VSSNEIGGLVMRAKEKEKNDDARGLQTFWGMLSAITKESEVAEQGLTSLGENLHAAASRTGHTSDMCFPTSNDVNNRRVFQDVNNRRV